MRRALSTVLLLGLALLLLAGCSGRLPEGLEEDELTARATAILDAVNARDYDKLVELYGDGTIAETGITRPTTEEWGILLNDYLDDFGQFEEYTNTGYITIDDDTLGEIAIVMVETQYASDKIIWQVSFITGYELVGLRL